MEKYILVAREALSDYSNLTNSVDLQHLLAILIGAKATPEICGHLSAYGVRKLADMSVGEFQNKGLSKIESQRIFGAFEMARKWMSSTFLECDVIRSPEDAARLELNEMRFLTQEHFVCIYLDTKNKVIKRETVFIGSLNASIVHPRECFKEAIRCSAASIICFHNHPSGDPNPSREDIDLTKRLVECGIMMGIEILDHIVIGDGQYVSFKEKGLI